MASLALRLTHLERHPSMWSKRQRRALLAHSFTEPQYAQHRERIIEALCSDTPQYSFTVEQEPAYDGQAAFYSVSWWTRGDAGKPYGKVIILEGGPEFAAIAPPAVSVYPGEWALDDSAKTRDAPAE